MQETVLTVDVAPDIRRSSQDKEHLGIQVSETQVSTLTQGAGDIPLHAYTNTARLGLITRGGGYVVR